MSGKERSETLVCGTVLKCWCTREEKHLPLQCQIVGLGMERDT